MVNELGDDISGQRRRGEMSIFEKKVKPVKDHSHCKCGRVFEVYDEPWIQSMIFYYAEIADGVVGRMTPVFGTAVTSQCKFCRGHSARVELSRMAVALRDFRHPPAPCALCELEKKESKKKG
jgi:hypothetical protein